MYLKRFCAGYIVAFKHQNVLHNQNPPNLAMISIAQPKNSAAIQTMFKNGFAYKLKWDFHDVYSEANDFYFLLFAPHPKYVCAQCAEWQTFYLIQNNER